MAEVFFNGPAGRIEGRFYPSKERKAPAVLILHPHPKYGGTMNNKVVYSMFKTFTDHGFSALRINFRGVGRSEGEFDNGIGELSDAATAMDWLHEQCPFSDEYWVAGFSFGAWVASQLIVRRPEVTKFLSVSPPVGKYDFSHLIPCPVPGLVIQGNKDSIVSEENVLDFVDKCSRQKTIKVDYKIIDGADHFFRTKLTEFADSISDYITTSGMHKTMHEEDKKDYAQSEKKSSSSGNGPLMLDDFI